MEYISICFFGYAILFFMDILPLIKKKKWKFVGFSLPIFVITFMMNVMIGLGYKFLSPNELLTNFISGFLGWK